MAYQYRNVTKSGAQKGWEEKKELWKEKDYQYEFGVSMGAAIGWAIQRLHGVEVDEDLMNKTIKYWFYKGLEMKSDPEVIDAFDEYYTSKKSRPDKTPKPEQLPTIDINNSPF